MAGAPIGNKNASRAKVWRAAIDRALDRRTARRDDGQLEIDALADRLIEAGLSGDLAALREFGDRIDGKAAQAVTVTGDEDGGPIHMVHEVALVAIDATEGRAAEEGA